jgi:hydrogenase-4 component C
MSATSILKGIAYVGFVLLAAPLLEGVVRKLKALIHSRKGPPLTQPYLDLMKLLVKEDLASAEGPVARFAPVVAFAAVLAAAFFVPFGVGAPAAGVGDVFVFIYLITLSATAVIAGAFAQSSPFSHLGGSREMMMVLLVESLLVVTLLIFVVSGHTALPSDLVGQPFRISFLLGLFCYLFAMQALLGKLPFDAPEAEQEIMEGPFIEYSGPSLALYKWTFYMKQLVLGSLFFNLFVPWPRLPGGFLGGLGNMVINYLAVMILGLVVVLVDATNPRLRIDQSLKFFGGLVVVALVGVGLAAFGY